MGKLSNIARKRILLFPIIALLIMVSIFPRSVEVINNNPVFGVDQGRDYMAVKNIVIDRKLTLIGAELGAGQAGLSYLFHGPGHFYMLSIPFIIYDGNPAGGTVLMLFFGLLAISFGIFFATKLMGWGEGILTGFLLALSPALIGQSRFVLNHFGITFFIIVIFYFIFLFTKSYGKKKYLYAFLATFFTAFTYNLETAITIPMLITLIIYFLFILRGKIISFIPIVLLALFIGFLPALLFEIRHGFMGIKSLLMYLFGNHVQNEFSKPIHLHAGDIINLFISSFQKSFPGNLVFPSHITFIGFIALTGFAFLQEKDRVRKNFIVFIILLFPINFLVFLLLRNIIFEHYITDLILAYLILLAFSVGKIYRQGYVKLFGLIFIYLLILLAIGSYNAFVVTVKDYNDYGGIFKLRGKIDAIDYIYKDASGQKFGLLIFSPPVYTYPYDYILWWHGQKKYNYTPYKEQKGTYYLLIEPDPQKPWSYKGWLETAIKPDSTIYRRVLPSGFIVEKRESQRETKDLGKNSDLPLAPRLY